MKKLWVWPGNLPAGLAGLFEAVAERIGAESCSALGAVAELESVEPPGGAPVPVVVVPEAAVTPDGGDAASVLGEIAELGSLPALDIVFVVGDAYLGTDAPALEGAMVAAAAVTASRSLAVRRGATTRANVVCVPAALLGIEGAQRGPLPAPVELADVAAGVAFLLGDSGSYLNGQVLFVNGGRQLFSSQTA